MGRIEPADALLVVNIGNTRVGLGVSDEDGIHDVRHTLTAGPDDWAAAVAATWESCARARQRAVVVGSVAPRATERMLVVLEDVCGVTPLVVRDDLPLPMALEIERPDEVGIDRVCSAAAAYERIQGACAIASFGTAATVDCVSADGRFLGGAILPGFEMSLQALHEHTAQLPRVELAAPGEPFGRNTHEAIINGVAFGMVGALREIVERFATTLREWPKLVITGGNAGIVRELADFVDAVVPDLCLMGIALTHRRAAERERTR
jgi:type III pantothenate kinase